MATKDDRKTQRFPVRLAVRFSSALEFVTEYAENLSSNGLYVRGAHKLSPLSEVGVDVTLPGLGTFAIKVKVAHVIDEAMAAKFGRQPGAGVEITEQPREFAAALAEYLGRLGRRRDVVLLVDGDVQRGWLEAMGFQVKPLPPLRELINAVAAATTPIAAVVVPSSAEIGVRGMLARAGADELVRTLDREQDLDALLTELDGGL